MRPAILFPLLLLTSCGGGEGNETAGSDSRGVAVQTADLTGLYEGQGEGERLNRICMISRSSGAVSFGIVTWKSGSGTCSGAGEVTRRGEVLRLAMSGGEECVIEARMTSTQIAFAPSLPETCAYYCGPGATLAGETFEKTGGTAEAAMRATDLVGDPLCG